MPKFIITGPCELKGEIEVKGAKNQALKIIPAAILSREKITIKNLPAIEDVDKALELIKEIGGVINRGADFVEIETANINQSELPETLVNKFRASVMFAGPTLVRLGEVKFPHPGGCVIGAGERPIDLFLEGFKAFGATITETDKHYHIKAENLHGAEYFFSTVTVTGTESLMMTAVLAEGTSILKNCALEPEIVALAEYLNTQGARISGAGTPTIIIKGVKAIAGGEFTVMPDRIEAGTFAIVAAATNSPITINNFRAEHLESLLAVLTKVGVKFESTDNSLKIISADNLKAYGLKTHEYPGFPTDLQSPYTVLMTQAQGASLIHETIYDRRLLFTDMLTQMGANIIMCDPHRVVVSGPTPLTGHKLTSPDLRAGISMVIAGLIAEGRTEIDNIYQIDRGYENIDERLRQLGAKITRIE